MSGGFTKLYQSILLSSVWLESGATRLLWITMLASADREGCVYAAVPGLAHAARITVPECEAGLEVLSAPDPHSRSKEHDGRRIEAIEGGWRILNYGRYRAMDSSTERVKAWRDKRRNETSATVSPVAGVAATLPFASASASEVGSAFQEGGVGETAPDVAPDPRYQSPEDLLLEANLRAKVEMYGRAARNPDAVLMAVAAEMNGMHGSATPAEMLLALSDMQANGEGFNISRLRGYLRRGREHEAHPPPIGKWTGTSNGAEALAAVVALIESLQVPGQGMKRVLRKANVQALGERHYAAVVKIGGVQRVIADASGERYGLLLRDFQSAWAEPPSG